MLERRELAPPDLFDLRSASAYELSNEATPSLVAAPSPGASPFAGLL